MLFRNSFGLRNCVSKEKYKTGDKQELEKQKNTKRAEYIVIGRRFFMGIRLHDVLYEDLTNTHLTGFGFYFYFVSWLPKLPKY